MTLAVKDRLSEGYVTLPMHARTTMPRNTVEPNPNQSMAIQAMVYMALMYRGAEWVLGVQPRLGRQIKYPLVMTLS